MGGVNIHLERIAVLLEQRLVPFRQLVGILGHVVPGDGEQDLVVGERIGVMLSGLESGRRLGDAAGPRRYRAVRVAGSLGSQRGQILPQPVRLGGGYRRGHGTGDQHKAKQPTDSDSFKLVHNDAPYLVGILDVE